VTRGLKAALAGCLLSAALLLFGAGRAWAKVAYPDRPRTVTGHDLVGSLTTWGLIALAGVVAVAATRRWGRILVGATLVASGTTAAALTADAIREVEIRVLELDVLRRLTVTPTALDLTVWPYITLAGGALLAATGVLVAARGPSWAGLSTKYDAPSRPPTEGDLWDAMDRGEDPTDTIAE
jgi:uncharacterized membrane protein (TIGR02234 family)